MLSPLKQNEPYLSRSVQAILIPFEGGYGTVLQRLLTALHFFSPLVDPFLRALSSTRRLRLENEIRSFQLALTIGASEMCSLLKNILGGEKNSNTALATFQRWSWKGQRRSVHGERRLQKRRSEAKNRKKQLPDCQARKGFMTKKMRTKNNQQCN